ncbi:hypothetical protein QMS56_10335 [Cronobacter malonaticus]|nr:MULTISPECIES: hypothetical protein [Cronobacter]EIZ9238762.1 hypothetical protein [Cronobacter sakazakii]EKK4044845.1 hypothetical protein [Cronobacter sakazakii]ELY3981339.1 hypothetical protein [Cronobacter sakazakii]ELY4639905.1 hypothetical protein [Cronobacter sakazakii]ELY4786321.1 hypothetical protein [Cronobacter sakazakii]
MALSNIELITVLNNAINKPNDLLFNNGIRIQRAKELALKEHARGFYFGDEQIGSIVSPNIDPFHVYIISPENCSRHDDYSLVIFPFQVTKLIPLIDKIEGISLGHIQLSSNFNAFKIPTKSKRTPKNGVGYSVKVDKEECLWKLIIELKDRLLLPTGSEGKLSSVYYQSGLPNSGRQNNTKQSVLEYFSLV